MGGEKIAMFVNFQYAYLTGDFLLFIIWLVLFVSRKDLRREMLRMSVLIAPLGPLSELFYLLDYWRPELFNGWTIGVEDLLFGFFIGGIAGVIYEEIFQMKYDSRPVLGHHRWVIGIVAFEGLLIKIGSTLFHVNSIYASILGFLIIGSAMLVIRKDLIRDALFSGFLVGILTFFLYLIFLAIFPGIIKKWWILTNISGVLVLGVPLEELFWAFGWGFVAGPMYEFISGKRLIPKK